MSRLRHITRIPALVISFVVVGLSVAAVAIADNLTVDGDTLTEFNDSDMIFTGTVPCNADTTRNARLAISRQGSGQVFENGSTVTVSAQSTHPAVTAPTTTISLPSNWEGSGNGTLSDIVTSLVTLHPTSPGTVNASLTFQATGPEGGNSSGSITRTNVMDVSWTAGSCDTTAPESTASAKNADNSTYTFGDWTKQNVTVTLAATDAGSGVKEIRYTTNGTDPTASTGTVYGTPFTINTEGTTTIKWRAIDNAGNVEAVRSAAVRIDKTAPSVSCGSADGAWHASDVSIACTAADTGGSGVAPASDESFSLSTNVPAGTETSNAQTNSRPVSDAAGNTTTAGPVGGNKVDKKGPGVSCGSADDDWHATDVSIACTATDGGSGVDPASDESFSLQTDVAAGTETANAETDSKTVRDAVGNTATAGPVGGNKVDKKGPGVSCDDADGAWHASDVSIACTASDGGSGLAAASPGSFSLSTSVPAGTETDDAETDSRAISDAVGNTNTAGPVDGNKVDKKGPGVSCDDADGAWHATDVSIACTANDGGSGLAAASPGSFSLSTSVPVGTETSNASTDSRTVSDAVGNTNTAGPVPGNKVDKKAPTVWCGSADGNWHASDVSIGCTAADGGSGVNPATDEIFSLSTTVPAGTETANALTNSRSISDLVGNTAPVGAIGGNKVDKKAPGVSCGSADGNWHATDVSIACTANDGGSGLAAASPGSFSLSTNVPAGTQTDNAETNSRSISDAVGNGSTAGPVGGNKVDKQGPVVTLTCPSGALRVGATATASWSASDGSGSGVVAPTSGSVALNTATVGGHTASAAAGSATDNVGNPSLLSTCNYSVEFDFTGFFQPIDNGGVFNKAKAGSAIPVKFSLDGAPRPGSNTPGLAGAGSAFAPSTPTAPNPVAAVVACPSSAALFDIVEELADTTSGLKYDPAADQWVYVWKTTTGLANSCRQLKVMLADGTTKTANFNFTK